LTRADAPATLGVMEQAPSAATADTPGVSECLSSGMKTTTAHVGFFLTVWAMTGVPPQILGYVVGLSTGISDQASIKAALEGQNWPALALLAALTTIGMALGLLGYVATVIACARIQRGEAPPSAGDAVLEAVGAIVRVALASALVGVTVVFGFGLLVVPGVYLLVRLSMAGFSSIVEETGPVDAFARSWKLVDGRFTDTLIFMLALFGAAFVGMMGVVAVGGVLKIATSPLGSVGALAAGLAGGALQFLVSAWATAAMTKYFLALAELHPRAAA